MGHDQAFHLKIVHRKIRAKKSEVQHGNVDVVGQIQLLTLLIKRAGEAGVD
jgi:hypothetical protein